MDTSKRKKKGANLFIRVCGSHWVDRRLIFLRGLQNTGKILGHKILGQALYKKN
jgi:hypothetical protein